jgi:hypothetical protein
LIFCESLHKRRSWPESEKSKKICEISNVLQLGSQKYGKMFKKKILLSYRIHSQIWLNLPMVNHYFGYITKFTKKITGT